MTIQADHENFTQEQVRDKLMCSAQDLREAKTSYESWLVRAYDAGLTTRTLGKMLGLDSTTVSERIRRIRKNNEAQPQHVDTISTN